MLPTPQLIGLALFMRETEEILRPVGLVEVAETKRSSDDMKYVGLIKLPQFPTHLSSVELVQLQHCQIEKRGPFEQPHPA